MTVPVRPLSKQLALLYEEAERWRQPGGRKRV